MEKSEKKDSESLQKKEKSEKTEKESESLTKTETPKKSESESDLMKGLIYGNVNYII
jgi:hypothetical protein